MLPDTEIVQLQRDLGAWFRMAKRDLPWRRTRDPYPIWVSETMLQQTRVTAVLPYYERFLTRFPDIAALATAPETDVLAAWAGLGYYYRARNMQQAARLMHEAGGFPQRHAEIRTLPGVGDYTAAAVASIAFGLPHAVVDGNVLRVISRICGDSTVINTTQGRRHFAAQADQLLDRTQPGEFNQAAMELGATICSPKNPQCLVCPVSSLCRARASGRQHAFPVKLPKRKTVRQQRTVYWIERNECVLAWQRPKDSSLMPGFWELPEQDQLGPLVQTRQMGSFRHGITFHSYEFQVVEAAPPEELRSCEWLAFKDLGRVPVSTIFKKSWRVAEQHRPTKNGSLH